MKTFLKFASVLVICLASFGLSDFCYAIGGSGGGNYTPMEHPELPPAKTIEDVSKLYVITALDINARTIAILSCATGKAKQYKLDTVVGVIFSGRAATLQEIRPGLKINGKVSPTDPSTLVTIITEEFQVEPVQ